MTILTKQLVFVLGKEYPSGRRYTVKDKDKLLEQLNKRVFILCHSRIDRNDLCGALSLFDGMNNLCAKIDNFFFEGDLLFADVTPYGAMAWACTTDCTYVMNWAVDEDVFEGPRELQIKGLYGACCTPLTVHPLSDTPFALEHI